MDKDRLSQVEIMEILLRTLSNGNTHDFARMLNVTPSTISRMSNGYIPLTPYYADKICTAFPQVNRDFVLSGKGYPGDLDVQLVKQRYESIISEKNALIRTLRKELELQQKVIAKLT